eukprot:scaffold49570_cov63-Phaeocystis_antarctica.AAC.1
MPRRTSSGRRPVLHAPEGAAVIAPRARREGVGGRAELQLQLVLVSVGAHSARLGAVLLHEGRVGLALAHGEPVRALALVQVAARRLRHRRGRVGRRAAVAAGVATRDAHEVGVALALARFGPLGAVAALIAADLLEPQQLAQLVDGVR